MMSMMMRAERERRKEKKQTLRRTQGGWHHPRYTLSDQHPDKTFNKQDTPLAYGSKMSLRSLAQAVSMKRRREETSSTRKMIMRKGDRKPKEQHWRMMKATTTMRMRRKVWKKTRRM